MENKAICTRVVTILSTAAIIASVASVGIAMDTDTGDGAGWVAMEVACACIFVLEIVVKTCVLGPCVYFCGHACHWNLFDVFLSSLAILEAFFSAVLEKAGCIFTLQDQSRENDSLLYTSGHGLQTCSTTARTLERSGHLKMS